MPLAGICAGGARKGHPYREWPADGENPNLGWDRRPRRSFHREEETGHRA